MAAQLSDAPNALTGGVLGTFAPGMLPAPLDAFVFSAGAGELSEPLRFEGAVYVVQRIETQAAVLELRIDVAAGAEDSARERVDRVRAELLAGADFAAVARERSDDRESAARGGQFAIFERGAQDTLLKAAAFELPLGAISEPIRSPLGWHLLKRVDVAAVDPSLAENGWVRLRCVLLRYVMAQGAGDTLRSKADAKALGEALLARLQRGESLAQLAREHDDDTGGRERAGDLGWIHRATPFASVHARVGALLQTDQSREIAFGESAPARRVAIRRQDVDGHAQAARIEGSLETERAEELARADDRGSAQSAIPQRAESGAQEEAADATPLSRRHDAEGRHDGQSYRRSAQLQFARQEERVTERATGLAGEQGQAAVEVWMVAREPPRELRLATTALVRGVEHLGDAPVGERRNDLELHRGRVARIEPATILRRTCRRSQRRCPEPRSDRGCASAS